MRILVVESRAVVAGYIAERLSAMGFAVAGPVATATEARRLFETEAIDGAVLSDAALTGRLLSLARALAARGTPVVLLNAAALPPAWEGLPVRPSARGIAGLESAVAAAFAPKRPANEPAEFPAHG